MIRDGGEIVLTFDGLAVQRFNVFQHVPEGDGCGAHLFRGEPVEHKRIVRVRTMRSENFPLWRRHVGEKLSPVLHLCAIRTNAANGTKMEQGRPQLFPSVLEERRCRSSVRARARSAWRLFTHARLSDRSSIFLLPALWNQVRPPLSLPGSICHLPPAQTAIGSWLRKLTGCFLSHILLLLSGVVNSSKDLR